MYVDDPSGTPINKKVTIGEMNNAKKLNLQNEHNPILITSRSYLWSWIFKST